MPATRSVDPGQMRPNEESTIIAVQHVLKQAKEAKTEAKHLAVG